MKIKSYVEAARLRTLPLSLSGIILGSGIAAARGKFDGLIFGLACLTTILFQILSNFANDYGDGIKGTDDHRKGEKRAVASGEITAKAMKNAMIITVLLSLLSAITLIFLAFQDNFFSILLFMALALLSVGAAIKYTVGSTAYGYQGLGDLFVFLFFGLLAVCGSYALYHQSFWWPLLLPASSIGMLSMAVLNLNNMRDEENDRKSGKNTLVVQMGRKAAKKYHAALVILPFLLCTLFVLQFFELKWNYFGFLLFLIPLLKHLKTVQKNVQPELLDAELKKVALSTFLLALVLGLSLAFF